MFVTADDLLPESGPNAMRSVTDAEVVTLAVAQAMMEPLVARVLTEHVRIRPSRPRDRIVQQPPVELLHELGSQLERHVRREERELFPLIEGVRPSAELRRLVGLLAR